MCARRNSGSDRMQKGMEVVMTIFTVGLLIAFLIPIAVDEILAVDTSSWSSNTVLIWELQPVFMVLGVLLFLIMASSRMSE